MDYSSSELHLLQRIIFPDAELGANLNLYYRGDFVDCARDGKVFLQTGERLWFDTYFNLLERSVWRDTCKIEEVIMRVEATGKFVLKVRALRDQDEPRTLQECIVDLPEGGQFTARIDEWASTAHELLFITVEALSDVEFRGGGFYTTQAPVNDIKLGIVVTHFNRKNYVVPAIRRMTGRISDVHEKISLIVVDNSRNITEEEGRGATVIQNVNYGGAGGFTRGLLHLKDNGFSHCLFMDDDATCEIESILRTYTILTYAPDPKLAVAGSLMEEERTAVLIEKGGYFNGMWHPAYAGELLLHHSVLTEASRNVKPQNYGGWWFFAFKIDQIRHFPYPAFVRGDDVMFGLDNDFNMITPLGVNCWAEDFSLKEGPLTRYLGYRSFLFLNLTKFQHSRKFFFKEGFKWFLSVAFSYNYASARALNQALDDVMKGPEFFVENMDASKIIQSINAYSASEKLAPMDLRHVDVVRKGVEERAFRRLVRTLTLNGMLFPKWLVKPGTIYQQKSFRGIYRQVFRFQRVLYYYPGKKVGFVAERSASAFMKLTFANLRLHWKLFRNFNKLSAAYKDAHGHMTGEAFWRKVYQDAGQERDSAS